MARLPYLDVSDLAPEHKHLLKRNINLLRLMSHSPKGATAFHTMGQYIRHESPLNPRLREMAILQIGYMTRSVYEYTHHIKISRDFGVSDEDIRAIANESKGLPSQLDALTQAVLRAAREMTQNFAASDTTFNELKAHLDKESLTDLVLIISFYNAVVRFLATMEIDNEPEYQALLAEFPFATD
jgi:alkylhydroperoxidase family enzyme